MMPGYSPPQWAGMTIIEVESVAKMLEVLQDEEYLRRARADELQFISLSNMQLVGGSYATFIEQ